MGRGDLPSGEQTGDRRAQIDTILSEFRDTQKPEGTPLQPAEAPRRLYHYTTLEGLRGITSTSALWASDVRYMNDASELSYAADFIDNVIRERFEAVDSDVLQPLLPTRRGFANAFEYSAQPFAACFCEKGDLLSQWRGYRAGEAGYSLGFDVAFQALAHQLPPRTVLRKVIYDPEAQKRSVVEVVDLWLRTADSLLHESRGLRGDEVFPYPAIWALQQALAEHHLVLKHPAFEEEHEWRLIKLVDIREELQLLDHRRMEESILSTEKHLRELGVDMPRVTGPPLETNAEGVEIQFRSSPLGLVPYVELPLVDGAGVFTGRLPLWEVVQGPTQHPDLSLESLGIYLRSHGYYHTELKPSQIPLR